MTKLEAARDERATTALESIAVGVHECVIELERIAVATERENPVLCVKINGRTHHAENGDIVFENRLERYDPTTQADRDSEAAKGGA